MANLFIIGNGFDLSHYLKTSYDDFKKFLLLSYPNIIMDELIIPEGIELSDGGIDYDENDVLSMLFYLIDEEEGNISDIEIKWRDIENSLGHLNFSQIYDYHEDIFDKDGDIDYWKTAARNENLIENLIVPATAIQGYFSEWVNSIEINCADPKKDFKSLLKENDQFLVFNYTDTLEVVYDVCDSNICYIHGRQGEEIHFGHGNLEDNTEIYMQQNIGSENGLNDIYYQLRKKTEIALEDNSEFFSNLEECNISRIYSYGFSFSEVDKIYLEEICTMLKTEKVIWYFNDYDSHQVENYKKILVECGFKGIFNTFYIT
ncbi:bacteriophage abortive infection AbiH family protein [Bacillus safensis]|uniref:bacteriophage abortive infection AbiH family protein n=1 Tax=Bacillus safensis TaxID=561879 RepID=UPI0030CE9E00